MSRVNVFQATGFFCLDNVLPSGLRHYKAAAVNIAKGDAIHISNGYATNATTTFDHTFVGIANADCDNSGGSAGDLKVEVIPYESNYQFIVPVEEDALITQASNVGTLINLQSVNTVDISDTVTVNPGFFVDEVEVSAEAVAVNTYGYAIGHFHIDS